MWNFKRIEIPFDYKRVSSKMVSFWCDRFIFSIYRGRRRRFEIEIFEFSILSCNAALNYAFK